MVSNLLLFTVPASFRWNQLMIGLLKRQGIFFCEYDWRKWNKVGLVHWLSLPFFTSVVGGMEIGSC